MSISSPLKNQKNLVPTMRWADKGWLSSRAYYDFWGDVFAQDIKSHFQNKSVADIGAGNGMIWEVAFAKDLNVDHLLLIDPDLHIGARLSAHPSIEPLPEPLHRVQPFKADTIIFKQSFHIVYEHAGPHLFEIAQAQTYISFAMPPDIDWPVSDAFLSYFRPSCPDMHAILDINSMNVKETKVFSYPVEMPRDEWIAMIKNRFMSCLHDVPDKLIAQEITWAQKNLPQTIRFSDTLECLIFGKK